MAANRHFAVTLKRSPHHWQETQRKTLAALGLNRFGKVVYVEDTPASRGILWKVVHAIDLTPVDGPAPGGKRKHKSAKPKAAAADKPAKKATKGKASQASA
jgi:ribosomal protein L30